MMVLQEFKLNIFRVIENQLSLRDFETWLYAQGELAERMDEDVIYEAFCFNYGSHRAKVEFKSLLLPYFDQDEFLLWKIKANMKDIIEGRSTAERIIYECYGGLSRDLTFLYSIGWHAEELECMEFTKRTRSEILEGAKDSAADLLNQILRQEKENPDFKITDFRHPQ
jgi:hypothetical protein